MQRVLLVTLILLLGVTLGFSQSLVLEPYGVSPAAVKADTVGNPGYLGIKDRVFTGLRNVGVESKVYLIATFEDSSLTSLSWDLYEKPDGSSAALVGPTTVDEASEIATFVADLTGTYRIAITEGTYGDTVVINAAKYLGVKGGAPNCSQCHSSTYGKFAETGHASFLTNALNGAGRYFLQPGDLPELHIGPQVEDHRFALFVWKLFQCIGPLPEFFGGNHPPVGGVGIRDDRLCAV